MPEPFFPQDFHVLVVDDDKNINEVVRIYLEHEGFQVSCASNGIEGIEMLESGAIHLVILDLMMPDMDGWEMCSRIRKLLDIPILMLTARGDSSDKLRGFEFGTDDYLVKPFDPNELVARAISLLRRSYQSPSNITPVTTARFGKLLIDKAAHNVWVDGQPVMLTPREYHLMDIFSEHPNQVLTRQQLLDLVWGVDYFGDERVVDVFVKRLRQKLKSDDATWCIVTMRGEGYKLTVER